MGGRQHSWQNCMAFTCPQTEVQMHGHNLSSELRIERVWRRSNRPTLLCLLQMSCSSLSTSTPSLQAHQPAYPPCPQTCRPTAGPT